MSFRILIVYQKAFELSMEIFELTKSFPVEERYALNHMMKYPEKYQRKTGK